MADRTLTVNGQPFTFNRDRFAGVRTMEVTQPLSDETTSIQVTVAGHSDLDGVYTTYNGLASGGADQWLQEGGNGQINTFGYNSENNEQGWFVFDPTDQDPNDADAWYSAGVVDRPWKPNGMGANHAVQITPVPETVTVDRTASVIDSDRKGESRPLLSKVVGGAAAAYSLRDLNDKAGNNKVVRVRRASDNAERDFLAKEVSNGTLKNWVNTQTVLPLDLQALVDSDSDGNTDGRTGSVIPAKAAYSLRNLSKNYTGNVVDVRRSSDDTTQGFTAAQVADGTLLSFTNADYVKYTSDFSAGTNGWGDSLDDLTAAGNIDGIGGLDDNLRLTIGSATSQHRAFRTNIFPISQKINFSARVFIPSTNSVVDSFRITDANGISIIASTTPTQDQWVTVTASNVTPINSSGQLRIFFQDGGVSNFAGNGSDVIYLREITVTQVTSDGHVSKWYDQSGNTNHATQGTPASQPKIVDGGSLLNELDFDGTDDKLTIDFGADLSQANSFFMVHQSDTTTGTSNEFFDTAGGNPRTLLDQSGNDYRMFTNASAVTGVSVTTDKSLIFALYNGTSSLFAKNGTATSALNAGTSGIRQNSTLGTSGGRFYDGSMQEVIIYNSDQTDNRTAIEANIGEHYSITGIPAYDNTVDGFVETWYDQSGHGNNLTRLVANSQPTIISGGSFILNANGHAGVGLRRDTSGSSLLLFDSGIDIINSHSFQYVEFQRTFAYTLTSSTAGGSNRIGYISSNNLQIKRGGNTNVASGINPTKDNPLLYTTFLAADGSASNVHVNGSERLNSVLGDGTGNTTFSSIGRGDNDSAVGKFILISELIIYASDQSANRPAIEANINNQYDIY